MVEQSFIDKRDVVAVFLDVRGLKRKHIPALPIPFYLLGPVIVVLEALGIFVLLIASSKASEFSYQLGIINFSAIGVASCLLYFLLMHSKKLYQIANLQLKGRAVVAVKTWIIIAFCIEIVFIPYAHQPAGYAKSIAISLPSVALYLGCFSVCARLIVVYLIQEDLLKPRRQVVLFGQYDDVCNSKLIAEFARGGYKVIGRFDISSQDSSISEASARFLEFAQNNRIDEVFILFKDADNRAVKYLLQNVHTLSIPIQLIASKEIIRLLSRSVDNIGSLSSVKVHYGTMHQRSSVAKRCFDLSLALPGLLLILPLLIVVAIAIRIETPGPVIFRQRRAGYNGRSFHIYKFRSMTTQDDGISITQAARNDKRVTRVGRFIRRTSIDELPQLLNVIRGDMSIVGPRPHALAHDDQYSRAIKSYALRQRMKPGITGWAQVNGYRGETPHISDMEMRVRYDIWYIKNWSMMLDVLAIARTIWQVAYAKNAY